MNLTDILLFGKAIIGGDSGGGGGTHNVMLLTPESLETAERIPAEVLGAELIRISDKIFKADDLIGGYFFSDKLQYNIFSFNAENTLDSEGIYTYTAFGDGTLALVSMYETVEAENGTVKSGTYITPDVFPYLAALFIYPA